MPTVFSVVRLPAERSCGTLMFRFLCELAVITAASQSNTAMRTPESFEVILCMIDLSFVSLRQFTIGGTYVPFILGNTKMKSLQSAPICTGACHLLLPSL
jgi:hypothetical protein